MRIEQKHSNGIPTQLLGRQFGNTELQKIRDVIQESVLHNRAEIARRVCRLLDWKNAGGQYQFMSARVALLKLHRRGLIQLPPPTCGNGNGKKLSTDHIHLPNERRIDLPVHRLDGLKVEKVESPQQSDLYNALINRYHYLGFSPMPGAQVRYLIQWKEGILGAIGFGASAWKVASRDDWIGWTPQERTRGLHLIVNNSRFLILPYVQSYNLASRVLAMSARRIPQDFRTTYGYAPVLLETFVQKDRFTGHCYRAANWTRLGQTTGRGKKHKRGEPLGAIKDIWVYPLKRNSRLILRRVKDHE